jgi:hypothetical protein
MSLADLMLGLAKDDLAILGEIAVSMSSLEYTADASIWVLLGLGEKMGLMVTGPLSLSQKTEMLYALSKTLSDTEADTLNKIIKEIDLVRPERNRKLHAIWNVDSSMTKVAVTLGSDRRSFRKTTITSDDLVNTRDSIRHANLLLSDWFVGFFRQHYPSPEKFFPQEGS